MFKKNFSLLFIGFFFCLVFCSVPVSAAGEDTVPPKINSIRLNQQSFSVGDTISIEVDVVEDGVGIYCISLGFLDEDHENVDSINFYPESDKQFTGKHNLTSTVPSSFATDDNYYLYHVYIEDFKWNASFYESDNSLIWPKPWVDDLGRYLLIENNVNERCNIYNDSGISIYNPNPPSEEQRVPDYRANTIEILNTDVMQNDTVKVRFHVTLEGRPLTFSDKLPPHIRVGIGDGHYYLENMSLEAEGIVSGELHIDYHVKVGIAKVHSFGIENDDYASIIGYVGVPGITFDPYTDENGSYLQCESGPSEKIGSKCYFVGHNYINVSENPSYINPLPSVNEIRFLDDKVTKPGVVRVFVDLTDDRGLSTMQIVLSCDSGEGGMAVCMNQPYAGILKGVTHYRGIVSVPVSQKHTVGNYHIDSFAVYDIDGNIRSYGGFKETVADENGYYCYDNEFNKFYVSSIPEVRVESEFNVAFETSPSNPSLISKLEDMEEGSAALIYVGSTSVAKSDIFSAIQGKDKTVIFYSDNYQWVFNGKDIIEPKDINLTIKLDFIYGGDYGVDQSIMKLDFADNGILPGKANIRIKSDYITSIYNLTEKIYLYFDNISADTLELVNNGNPQYVIDDTDHWCYFDITHNSRFLLSGTKLSKKKILPSVRVTKITLSGISKQIAAGKSIQLTSAVHPKNATNKKLKWLSSNTKVATVSKKGKVSIKKGTGGKSVIIIAKATDGSGKKATFYIKVMKGAVKSIKIKGAKKTLKAGKTMKLKATVKVTKGKPVNKKVKWSSSNKRYATVSSKGVVKAQKEGKGKKVTITAMATDGTGKKKKVTIKIK